MLASFFLNLLIRKGNKEADALAFSLYAILDESDTFTGLLMYKLMADEKVCYLWYIMVEGTQRGQGLGSAVYKWMLNQAKTSLPGLRAVVFEIERPDQAANEEERILSEKRMRFYRKNGALVATNVVYHQSVGDHYPSKLMYLCLHPLQTISPDEAIVLLKGMFGKEIDPVESITLE